MRALSTLLLLALVGCYVAPPPSAVQPIANDGPIRFVRTGMTPGEVEGILGKPDDTLERGSVTGAATMYSAREAYQLVHYYRSVGRVVFGKDARDPSLHVVRVEGDRYEPGVSRPTPEPAR